MMSKSARSVFVFGLYLGLLGITLLITPNFLLGVFSIPSTTEVWVRIVGMLLFWLGVYYILAARKEMTDFFQWTVYIRSTVILFLIAFVLLGFTKPILVLIGAVDLLGAIWTGMALRSPKSA
jgi:Kef-type K+ transport system membrane component KefB